MDPKLSCPLNCGSDGVEAAGDNTYRCGCGVSFTLQRPTVEKGSPAYWRGTVRSGMGGGWRAPQERRMKMLRDLGSGIPLLATVRRIYDTKATLSKFPNVELATCGYFITNKALDGMLRKTCADLFNVEPMRSEDGHYHAFLPAKAAFPSSTMALCDSKDYEVQKERWTWLLSALHAINEPRGDVVHYDWELPADVPLTPSLRELVEEAVWALTGLPFVAVTDKGIDASRKA